MLRLRLLLAICCVSLFARASEPCESLRSTLQTALEIHWDSSYQPLKCSDNIYHFKEEILSKIDSEVPIYAVYVRKWNPIAQPIFPLQAREGATKWGFHMFLLVDGFVVDLDYTTTPQVVSWQVYSKTMWGESDGIYLQFKNAREYEATETNGRFNERDYSLIRFSEFQKQALKIGSCTSY